MLENIVNTPMSTKELVESVKREILTDVDLVFPELTSLLMNTIEVSIKIAVLKTNNKTII